MHANASAPRMTDQQSPTDARQRYEDAMRRAMQYAERYLPRDQALEIAHEVATTMLSIPVERVTATLIFVAVTNRLRSHWRSSQRRAAFEGEYHDIWSAATSIWSDPSANIRMRELRDLISDCIAGMPTGMREVFLLVRDQELSYKEAAARLEIGVGTVHTQFSRATALLRQCVAEYQADEPGAGNMKRRPQR